MIAFGIDINLLTLAGDMDNLAELQQISQRFFHYFIYLDGAGAAA